MAGVPITVGLNVPAGRGPRLDLVAGAEELGFDAVWTGEHLIWHTPVLDALTLLAAYAAATRRVLLGSGIYLLALRPPVVAAKVATTVDQIAQGRLILGIGVGGENPREYEAAGVPLRERGRRTDESIDLLRRLWREERVTHRGLTPALDGVTLEPTPVQPGGPPIWIGGRSEAALQRAALRGDGWLAYFVTPDRYAQSMARIRTLADAAGRSLDGFVPAHLLFTHVNDSYELARQEAARHLARSYNQDFETLASKYCALGTAEQCLDRVQAWVSAGVRHVVIRPVCRTRDFEAQMLRCAQELLPGIRRLPVG